MISFIDYLSKVLRIEKRELIEVDLILWKILLRFSRNEFFSRKFLFKGGSCLINCYLDYYRFSEDLDFTWKDQSIFEGKSKKQQKKCLSTLINKLSSIINDICKELSFDFKNDKNDKRYIEYGSNKKMLTFKLYFNSEVLRITKFIKIQINFIEKLMYNPKQGNLKSIIPENDELSFLFPNEYKDLREVLTLQIYDIKEILCEKIRAILTRESIKARDLVDIYFILEKERINLKDLDLEKQIIEKIKFAINLYEKYRTNLQINSELIITEDFFDLNDVQPLLIKKINLEHFNDFVRNIRDFLLTKILPKLSS